MKKAICILIFAISLVVISCKKVDDTNVTGSITSAGRQYHIIELDGCEYIEYDNGYSGASNGYAITHKGNCKYCKTSNPCN